MENISPFAADRPDNPLCYPSMPYGSPGEEALKYENPTEEFSPGDLQNPVLSQEHTLTQDTLEDINGAWPFLPCKEDILDCLSSPSLLHLDDISFSDSHWDLPRADEGMECLADFVFCHATNPVDTADTYPEDGSCQWVPPSGLGAAVPIYKANCVSPVGFEKLSEGTTMQRSNLSFLRGSYGIVKKRSEKPERTSAGQYLPCYKTARVFTEPRTTPRGIKGVTQCLRALLRQLLAGTGWIMDSSISKDEATCLIKMLIGPELESRVMIDLPVENTAHLPTGWKAMHYSTILAGTMTHHDDILSHSVCVEIMTYYIGKEIEKTESEQYITHRRGPYRLSARFKEILSGRPWPPHLPHSEDLRAFGCYREGEAGHRSPGKEYTTITFVESLE